MPVPRTFQTWRDTVPFTDAEVAAALESLAAEAVGPTRVGYLRQRAARVRQGFLSAHDLREALPVLVKSCFCGKPALYRIGCFGRCREHKRVRTEYAMERDTITGCRPAEVSLPTLARSFNVKERERARRRG